MNKNAEKQLSLLFVVASLVVIIGMVVVIFVATRPPVVVVLPEGGGAAAQDQPAGAAPAVPAGPTAADSAGATGVPAVPPTLEIVRVPQAPALDSPLDSFWQQVAVHTIKLEKQQSAEPVLPQQTVDELRVQAVHDGQRIVWRLSWNQPQPCYRSNVGEFSDAVAMQFPLKDGAPYTMGGPDMPVDILYWKALWQKDVDEGFQDITKVYPNLWVDFYWFADKYGPVSFDVAYKNELARQYQSGWAVGNPMSNPERTKPIEELGAHGFGSSTDAGETPSNARGEWHDGVWYVVIDRPMTAGDPLVDR
ncbi:MAG: hypothetical protein D6753_09335 [Planctomycetota bacterium]|nr:MAG: hypothetical protein D6753_09335 [Planctomycetota bacterium]